MNFKKLLFAFIDLISWPFSLFLMCLASIPVVLLFKYLERLISVYAALICVPVFYFIWLFSFLIICSIHTFLLGIFFKKPKELIFLRDLKTTLSAAVFHVMSRRSRLIWSLPLIQMLLVPTYIFPFISKLVFKSYTLGKMSAVYTFIGDPDLVHIGKNVIIGLNAMLISHAMKTTKENEILYLSDPIIIGDNVTVGADAYIAMGAVLEKNSLVLAKSYVKPKTIIKANEVWGGNPAIFIRKRT